MDKFSKTVQYSIESTLLDIPVRFNFSDNDGLVSPISFSFTDEKISVNGTYNIQSGSIYYSVNGGILRDSAILLAIVEKSETLPTSAINA